VGSRLPRANRVALANWVMSHLPIALAITAAGAGMVSLIGHAHDARTPAGTSWLLAGAVATGLLALVLTEQALAELGAALVLWRRSEQASPTRRGRFRNALASTCAWGRRTRVARSALELAPILCAAPALGSGHRFPLAQLGAGGERLVEAVAP
jgi:hypothetical protein